MYKIQTVEELRKNTSDGNHKFEVVSLFAGGGGSSTGYRMAGGKILAINEFIPEAVDTYRANWPETKIISDDIRKTAAKDILNLIGRKSGELDLLDGSPPCSAFSTAGKMDKNWGKTKKYSDAIQSNVEDLFYEYIRILEGIKPKVFIAENVSGLVKGASKGYFNDIINKMRKAGYVVSCKVLDARWLGVPQRRARTIFVGVRSDLWRDEYKGKLHPKPFSKQVTLAEAFNGLNFTDEDAKQTDISAYSVYLRLKKLAPGEEDKIRFNLKKCSPVDVSYCVLATGGNIGAASIKHWDDRAFTISEVKRIMSVPDDYVLTGNFQQQYERLGRMVAPLMMKAVAENLLAIGVIGANT
jgi:DNA (cytosine-5)-methyltransferase 1